MPDLLAGPTKRAPSAEIPGVTMPANIFAGESEALQRIGSNIQQTGGRLADIALRKDYLEFAEQYEVGSIEYLNFLNDQEKARLKDTYHSKKAINFNKVNKTKVSDILSNISNARAKRELDRFFRGRGSAEELRIFRNAQSAMLQEIDDRQIALSDDYIKQWFEAPERNKIKIENERIKYLYGFESTGIKPKGWAKAQRIQDAFNKGKEAIRRDPELARKMLAEGGDIEVLMSEREAGLMDEPGRRSLRELAASRIRYLSIQNTQEDEKAKAEAEEKIWDIARTGNVNGVAELIDTYDFEAEWKKKQLADANRTANLIKEGKANPYNTISDPESHHNMYMKCLLNPESVKISELAEGVPSKWGHNQFKEMKNLLTSGEDDPLRKPQAIEYLKMIKSAFSDSKGKLIPDEIDDWDKTNRAMRRFIIKNPDATPEQMKNEYNSIIEPYVKSKFQKFLEFLDWEEFKGEVAWLAGGRRKTGKAKKAAKETETAKPSESYVLGEVIEVGGKKYKIVSFREEDGEPMVEPVG